MTEQLRQDDTQIYLLFSPEPLGTALKVVCDGLSGHMTYLEAQEGKERMKKNFLFEDQVTTSACVARASKFCSDIEKVEVTLQHDVKNIELWIEDSWCGSVQTVAHLAKNG